MNLADHETALVLSGGGARAAYQVGCLRALARSLPRGSPLPFPIVCGTSAGAINAAMLAAHADDFRRGVARLVRWWRRVDVADVYRADLAALSRHSARWLAGLLVGRGGPPQAASLLDNAPLRSLVAGAVDFARIDGQVKRGHLHALAINATSYATGEAITFFQGALAVEPWRRQRRSGRRTILGVDHLMASTAIPFVFPAVRVGGDWHMDGSVRQLTPLSPALKLGARRVLVLAVGQFAGQRAAAEAEPGYPSFAQTVGHALSTIFLDNLAADLERMHQLNRLAAALPGGTARARPDLPRHVDALVLAPSRDLGEAARDYAHRLPRALRVLLKGFGSTRGTGSNLVSYLMFEPAFLRTLLALGDADARARQDELAAFLAARSAAWLPLPPRP